LLAVTREANEQRTIRVVPFEREPFQAKAGEGLAAAAARPAVLKADRSGARPGKPQPPGEWAPPPAADKAAAPLSGPAVLGDWPAAFGDTQAVLLSYVFKQKPQGRHELHAQRVELPAGRKVGEPQMLWPWSAPPEKAQINVPGHLPDLPLAA